MSGANLTRRVSEANLTRRVIRTRRFGRADVRIPEIGLGCYNLTADRGVDRDTALATLQRAYELGVRFFDTAPMYGDGECDELLGMAFGHLGADEVLTGVSVPALAANQVAEYAKMAHPATSFAVVGAAAVVTLEGDGGHGHGHDHGHDHDHGHGHDHAAPRCTAARVAIGGPTPKPTRSPAVEAALAGSELTLDSIAAATAGVGGDLGNDLLGDVYASADYRRSMAAVELKHALYHAVGLAHH